MFTDASKYTWSVMLTQEYTNNVDEKMVSHQHPLTYVSGLFQDSQLHSAVLMKDMYVIYMSIKNLSFHLTDAVTTP